MTRHLPATARPGEKLPFHYTEGWAWPNGAVRAHYLRMGASLCGYFGSQQLFWALAPEGLKRCHFCQRTRDRELGVGTDGAR